MEYSSFAYNGVRSSDFGIYIAEPPKIPIPSRRLTKYPVPGRNGSLIVDDGSYEDITITYQLHKTTKWGKVEEYARDIKAWLLSDFGINKLSDSYDSDFFRYGTYEGGDEFENSFNMGSFGSVSFSCNPIKYSNLGQYLQRLDTQGTVINEFAFPSYPYLKIYGQGSGSVYIENQAIAINPIDGYVEIDSDIQQAYKDSQSKNNTVNFSAWPIFRPGENIVQWDGGITKIEYIPRWCTL